MADHDTHDHTGIPGISSGSVASDPIWDAAGDLAVGTGANTAAKLTIGSSGTVLQSNGTTAAWAAKPGNLWTMNKSSSQTLTAGTDTLITFDTTVIDGGGSVIDLAGDEFDTPATGFYMAYATWIWEATAPSSGGAMACYVNGSDNKASRCRLQAATMSANGGLTGQWALSLSSGDVLELYINPGAGVTPTARGNASPQIATSFTLVRIT